MVATRLLKQGRDRRHRERGKHRRGRKLELLPVGRIPGSRRPAIGVLIPTPTGHTILLDVGANSDCKAIHLYQFAVMGKVYAQ